MTNHNQDGIMVPPFKPNSESLEGILKILQGSAEKLFNEPTSDRVFRITITNRRCYIDRTCYEKLKKLACEKDTQLMNFVEDMHNGYLTIERGSHLDIALYIIADLLEGIYSLIRYDT